MQAVMPYYRRIAAYLRGGGLIAYPTESCYGLGCDPANRSAVLRLLRLKQRSQRKGLILIASSYRQLVPYLQALTLIEQARLQNDNNRAVSYLMPVRHATPRWLRGAHDTLAVRLTAHSFAKQLCKGVHSALVSTSANRTGMRPVKTYAECQRLFGKDVWVLPGLLGKSKHSSQIQAWGDGRIVR